VRLRKAVSFLGGAALRGSYEIMDGKSAARFLSVTPCDPWFGLNGGAFAAAAKSSISWHRRQNKKCARMYSHSNFFRRQKR
jgi:hypothetical protein